MQLNQILGRFQSLSENCLMYLHLEQRVRCFLFLAPLFKGAKFNVGNSDALETDVEVERLETEGNRGLCEIMRGEVCML